MPKVIKLPTSKPRARRAVSEFPRDARAPWTVKEVAAALRVSDQTIFNMVKDGQIKALRIRYAIRISDKVVRALLGEE